MRFKDTHFDVTIRVSKAVQAVIDRNQSHAKRLGELLAQHIGRAVQLDQSGRLLDRAHVSQARLGSRSLSIYTRFVGDKTLGRVFFSNENNPEYP